MKLFNIDHFPVVNEGTKFDFRCSLPDEDLIDIDIRRSSVNIKPMTKHDGSSLLELTDDEKQRLFDILINIDNIRMLGKKVTMLVSVTAQKLLLHYFDIDDTAASAEQRGILCDHCGLEDAVVGHGLTLSEFLHTVKLRHHSYDAVTEDGTVYTFTVMDIANYSKALQKKAEEAAKEANTIRVVYSSPDDSKETKEKIRSDAERKQEKQELEKKLTSLVKELQNTIDETVVFRSMADIYRIFSRL